MTSAAGRRSEGGPSQLVWYMRLVVVPELTRASAAFSWPHPARSSGSPQMGSPTRQWVPGAVQTDDGSAPSAMIVGTSGTILLFGGQTVTALASPSTRDLFAAWGSDPSNFYAAGSDPAHAAGPVVIRYSP